MAESHVVLYPLLAQTVPSIAGSAVEGSSWWEKYGLAGLGLVVFGSVIAYLFKLMRADQLATAASQKALSDERASWAVEREKIRTEFEAKHLALSEQYNAALVAEIEANRENDNEKRRAEAERFEVVAANQQRNYDQMLAVVNKLTDQTSRPSRPR